MSSPKPRFNAYKPVKMTDGLRSWVNHTFDMSKEFTADDMKMWKADHRDYPAARIADMRKRLSQLPDNPSLRVHVAEILRILDSMPLVATGIAPTADQWSELRRADMLEGKILVIRDLLPKAVKGERFAPGRDAGAVSPLRKAIRAHLRRHPTAKTAEVWEALRLHPPRDHEFLDNSLGKYVEHGVKPTSYRTFQNLVSLERGLKQ